MGEPMTDAFLSEIVEADALLRKWGPYVIDRGDLINYLRRLLSEVRRLRGENDSLCIAHEQYVAQSKYEAEEHDRCMTLIGDLRARLAQYEPEVKDETPCCRECGSKDLRPWYDQEERVQVYTCAGCGNQWFTNDLILVWRYLASQAILNGGK